MFFTYIHVLSRIGHYWPAAPVARLKNTYHIVSYQYIALARVFNSKMAANFAWPSVSVHRRLAVVVNRKIVQRAWCDSVHGVTALPRF